MRKTLIYTLTLAAALLACSTASAQNEQIVTPKELSDGIVVNQFTTDNGDGTYTMTLESFVTGYESTITKHVTTMKSQPMDAVLVLDVSGSMDDYLKTSYYALPNQAYSYNKFDNVQDGFYIYYRHTDGKYYEVDYDNFGGWGVFGNAEYCLYVKINGTRYYLSGTGLTTTQPTNINDKNKTIWTGTLYRHLQKMEALQSACKDFVDVVAAKATEGNVDHRVAVVKYSGYKKDNVGDGFDSDGDNYTQIVKELTTDYASVKNAINQLEPSGPTAVDWGLEHAQSIINGISNDRQSHKLVIVFTDGEPNHGSGFSTSVADNAIKIAGNLKADGVTVYTIGIFEEETNNIRKYMNYTSSNYPSATSMSNSGTMAESKYYFRAQDDKDLEDEFVYIAETESITGEVIGGEDVSIDKNKVQLNCVVTPHFIIPDGNANIKVYTQDCTGAVKIQKNGKSYTKHPGLLIDDDGHVWYDNDGYSWGTKTNIPAADIHRTSSTYGTTISVVGYDFSENWVGLNEDITVEGATERIDHSTALGRKLVIEITVAPDPEAEGGEVPAFDKDKSGLFIDGEKPVNVETADVFVPIDIIINVKGLREGETAIFKVNTERHEGTIYVAITGEGAEATSDRQVAKVPVMMMKNGELVPIKYTVTELTDWTWNYDSLGGTIESHDLRETNVFNFTVSRNEALTKGVKHDESMKHNIFTQTIGL